MKTKRQTTMRKNQQNIKYMKRKNGINLNLLRQEICDIQCDTTRSIAIDKNAGLVDTGFFPNIAMEKTSKILWRYSQ